jgi:hypothetical protein
LKYKNSLIKKTAEAFNECFVVFTENVKRQSKNSHINDNNNTDNHTHFMEQDLLNLTQVWNVNAQQQKKLNKL